MFSYSSAPKRPDVSARFKSRIDAAREQSDRWSRRVNDMLRDQEYNSGLSDHQARQEYMIMLSKALRGRDAQWLVLAGLEKYGSELSKAEEKRQEADRSDWRSAGDLRREAEMIESQLTFPGDPKLQLAHKIYTVCTLECQLDSCSDPWYQTNLLDAIAEEEKLARGIARTLLPEWTGN